MQESVEYLDHIVSKSGSRWHPRKLKAIVEMPHLRYQKEFQALLGMVNRYGKFMLNLLDLCAPRNALLQKRAKWGWSVKCKEAVLKIKDKPSS